MVTTPSNYPFMKPPLFSIYLIQLNRNANTCLGPYFVYVYLAGSENKRRRPDLWAKSELQRGLDEMNEYELGNIMSYASLQSVVWKVFCRKAKCTMQDRWTEARQLVEQDMAGYEV
jgi:hypothetical protein